MDDEKWEEVQRKLQILQDENKALKDKLEGVSKPKAIQKIEHSGDWWAQIEANCTKKAGPFGELAIKAMIKSGEATVNDQNIALMTLLIIAARNGNYDLTQFLLNNGADIDAKDIEGETALDHTRGSNYPHVEKLLLFSQMNMEAGNDIKEIVETMQQQNGINDCLSAELTQIGKQSKVLYEETLMELMKRMIRKRKTFCDNQLVYAFNMAMNENEDILKSELWLQIRTTVSDIVQNGTKKDWIWLKVCLLPSTIWYMDLSKEKDDENKEPQYLYFELLKLVNVEAMNQINKLEENINKMANAYKNDWNALVEWDIPNKYNEVRQDKIVNGIATRFSYDQLSASSGTTFNSPNFYDYNQYLSQLVLLAQIVDEEFHESVQKIFDVDLLTNRGKIAVNAFGKEDDEKEILGNGIVEYMRGPVKLIERARAKAQNDYAKEPYPASACVIDFNRCALIFDDISSLLRGLKLFVNKVKYYQSGNIIDIARDKNGFIEYIKMPQYADIKLNVVIKGKHNSIIGEVQFLLRAMKDYKDKAHNLYAIQRKEESMNGAVSKTMPILLDRGKEIVGIACSGDVKKMCSLMILQNQSIKDIMFVGPTKETVFIPICVFGHLRLLKTLASMMTRKEFVDYMFLANMYDSKPIETAVEYSNMPMVKYLFDMKEVQARYKDDDPLIFRILMWVFGMNQNEHLTKYMLSTLGISKQKVIEMLNYRYPEELAYSEDEGAYRYDLSNIIGAAVEYGTVGHLKRLIKFIGQDAFLDNVFEEDQENYTTMDKAIMTNKVKVIEFLLSFNDVKEPFLTDDDELAGMVLSLCDFNDSKEAVQYCVDNLKLTEAKIEELQEVEPNIDVTRLADFLQ